MNKTFFLHNMADKAIKVTVAGIYNEEDKTLTISGIGLSHKCYSKALGRREAAHKRMVRPFVELSVESTKQANRTFVQIAMPISWALLDSKYSNLYPRVHRSPKAVAETVETEVISAVETETPAKGVISNIVSMARASIGLNGHKVKTEEKEPESEGVVAV